MLLVYSSRNSYSAVRYFTSARIDNSYEHPSPESSTSMSVTPESPDRAARSAVKVVDAEPPGDRERQLHLAAHELFASQGLSVPLAEIAKAAGVGVATLYRRYRDKDMLILEVYREHLVSAETLSAEANTFPDAWAGLVYFLRRTTDQFTADRGMRELILGGYVGGVGWARQSTHAELIEALNLVEKRVTAALETLVMRAKEQGVLRSDFEPTDLLLMSAMAHAAAPVRESGWPVRGQRALELLLEGIRPMQ